MKLMAILLCTLFALPTYANKGLGGREARGSREKRAEELAKAEAAVETANRELNETLSRVVGASQTGTNIPEIRLPRVTEIEVMEELAKKANALKEALDAKGEKNLANQEVAEQFAGLVENANVAMASRSSYASAKENGVEGAAEVLGVIDNVLNHMRAKISEPDKTNEEHMNMIYKIIGEVNSSEASAKQVKDVIDLIASLGKATRDVVTCR